ncbi:MAG TPA: DUF1328 domain-containing protein [Tepidisphaeraceae bacterium]|nr:DUF1328 domain-containing protein [Tepidisphaeraceae bacterium]
MGYSAAVFFIIAIASAILGFGGFQPTVEGPARVFFFVSCIVFLTSLVVGKLKNERA